LLVAKKRCELYHSSSSYKIVVPLLRQDKKTKKHHDANSFAMFVWLISYQPTVFLSQNKSATSNHTTIFFSQNKSAPVISHQPNEHAVYPSVASARISR
jgi:hypothetical protein